MKIIPLNEIKKRVDLLQILASQKEGFKAYSQGKVIVPPVGHLSFKFPPGDCHIKYGHVEGDDVFVIKIAGGFYDNLKTHDISATQGLILVLSAVTGQPMVLLQDDGYLTNLRTAIAGLIAAKHLAPKNIEAIGVLGTGEQAFLQVAILKDFINCRNLWVWGRNVDHIKRYAEKIGNEGFDVKIANSPREIAQNCNLIITTTASNCALLKAEDIRPGTHITAIGADTPGKQELDPMIFRMADICAVDSKSQCMDHGDTFYAIRDNCVNEDDLVELGVIIARPDLGRTSENQITLIDLTGIAIQDIQIAKEIARI